MDKLKTGALIKSARVEKGYTQLELGNLIGVTNKAVSRWENGDSFPDITLLDILASTLDLKIEDIVLGEKSTDSPNPATDEIIKAAKLQEKQRTKNIISGSIGLLIILDLIINGYCTMFGSTYENWPTQVYGYSLVIILLFITIRALQEPDISLKPDTPRQKHFYLFTILTGIYITILTLATMIPTLNGRPPFDMELTSVGPFINNQLAVIYAFHLICTITYFIKNIKNEEKITVLMYLNISVMHLSLIYSDLLHRIDELDLKFFLCTFLINTAIISLLSFIMIAIATLSKKKLNQKR